MDFLNRLRHPLTWLKYAWQAKDLPDSTKPGLEVKFVVGEKIPMKGIWFTVQTVNRASLILAPESMTYKQAKRIQGK